VDVTKARRLALPALLFGATGIGFAPVLVRMSDVGPSATAFFRLIFALPFLWVWMWLDHRQTNNALRPSTRGDFLALALTGLFFAGDLAIWHWSLRFTPVANSTLLANFAPLFVTLGAWLFLAETITSSFMAGMVTAFAGAALLVGARIGIGSNNFLGGSLALTAAVFYAGYLLMIKQLRRRFTTPSIMSWSGIVSAVSLLVIALLSKETVIPIGTHGWLVLAALGLVSHLGGQTLIAYALGHLPAAFSSLNLLLQPVIAALLAWVLLKERLTLWQWTGGIVVLCGIALAGRKPQGTRARQEPESM
jgi:drug/metabolite transporter (DMT)-like permease